MIDSLYDCFKHWSEHGSVWLYSDPHFDDEDCKLMDPNWVEPEVQIENINKKVYKNDTLVFLGDMGNPEWLSKLKCKNLVLISGNHDDALGRYRKYFKEVYTGPVLISPKIMLSHEPIYLPFVLNIHGHDHSQWWDKPNHINICSNVVGYTPINLKKIIQSGGMSKIKDIHRFVIDRRDEEKEGKENE